MKIYFRAGIGRSATLVLCDIALRSGITGYYNFFDTTKKLRECRAGVIPNPVRTMVIETNFVTE